MGLRAKGDAPGPALRPVVMRAGRAWRIAPSTDIARHKAGEEEGAAANGGQIGVPVGVRGRALLWVTRARNFSKSTTPTALIGGVSIYSTAREYRLPPSR